jgi:peptidoglycan/LPS O-acetylase OafA/YrhL
MALNSTYIGSFTHFWSLSVEEQYYFFAIFLLVFTSRKYIKGIILFLIALSILLMYYFKFFTEYWMADILVICRMHTLGLGALIAYYMVYNKKHIESLNMTLIKIISVIFILIFAWVFIYRKPENLYEALKHLKDPAITIIYFLR